MNDLFCREWSDIGPERKCVFTTLFGCFVVHRDLVSLIFMGQITTAFVQYTGLLKAKVNELVDALNMVDDVLLEKKKGKGRISSRPKVHMLYYLMEDVERFATAMHYASEKGEQFNKFTREHIFHTNRQNPS